MKFAIDARAQFGYTLTNETGNWRRVSFSKGWYNMRHKATKARIVLKQLRKAGWDVIRANGAHKILKHTSGKTFCFCFHDNVEIGPKMMADLAKQTAIG